MKRQVLLLHWLVRDSYNEHLERDGVCGVGGEDLYERFPSQALVGHCALRDLEKGFTQTSKDMLS